MSTNQQRTDDLHLGDFTSLANRGAGAVPKYYGEALVDLARENPTIVAMGGDLSPATESDLFRDTFPERFFMVGIAEANMVGVAAGMARMGDIPFVHSFSVFLSRRAFDQVAMQLAYPKTNVKLVGFLPGLTTLLGVSHQAIEDIALMRSLPNMAVVEPSGPAQHAAAVRAVAAHQGPVYMRMSRANTPLPDDALQLGLELGKGQLLRDGSDAMIFACGQMVDESMRAADMLANKGINVSVANIHTIKPLDCEFIIDYASRCDVVLTAENHSIIGGLGSAVAETLMEANIPARFTRIGVQDTFAEGGSTPYLFDKYKLSSPHIVARVEQLLNAKEGLR